MEFLVVALVLWIIGSLVCLFLHLVQFIRAVNLIIDTCPARNENPNETNRTN